MAKKLICVWLSLTLLIFSSISVYAGSSAQSVTGSYFLKQIVINGETIQNEQLSNPVVFYKELVYVPLDKDLGQILGYSSSMDWNSRTLTVKADKHIYTNVTDRWTKNNLDDLSMTAYSGVNVQVQDRDSHYTETLDTKGYPVLAANNTLYLPLNVLTSSTTLGIKSFYDFYTGIYITTTGKDPKTYIDKSSKAFNQGAVDYINSQNGGLYGTVGTLDMVLYFKYYGKMYGVDPTLLMGVARTESGFKINSVNSQNCCGLMQIMASTGAGYGFTKSQLLTAKGNIQMGAAYIAGALKNYSGNVTKALSAYNMGAGNVAKGKVATAYVKKVTSNQSALKSKLKAYGYSC